MERRGQPGLLAALVLDVVRLHETWMEVVFPRQLNPSTVLGKWKPETLGQRVGYYLWAALGAPPVIVVYPFLLLGFATRFYARKFDSAVTRLGVLGVVLAAALGWGALTLFTYLQLAPADVKAVGIASVVAVVAAGLAAGFSKAGGRLTSVLLAYPFAMTALFLPPVVAALVTPRLQPVILDPSYELAAWLLDRVFAVGGLNDVIREAFNLETFGTGVGLPGLGYLLMWIGISIPIGWFLGGLVALADLVRPAGE